ncbi:MAG: PRD domain-containing protein [Oenococcus oeni]
MRVIKKINNNVAICLDGNNNELVAFGKGIGFPKMPYVLNNLSLVTMTFYKLDTNYYQLLKEIPEDILALSAEIVVIAQKKISGNLNPNLVFSLADHINFSITRMQKYQNMKLAFSYDIEQLYPKETKMGRIAVNLIKKRLCVVLPDSEITALAMHFVNSQKIEEVASTKNITDQLIEGATQIIEKAFFVHVDQRSFNYNRFVMHLRYYIKRIQECQQFSEDDISTLFSAMKQEFPKIYFCSKKIADSISNQLNTITTNDEIFYLMIYVKRIIQKEKGGIAHE